MRFITITLIVHAPDPLTGAQKSTKERFREVIGNARLAEDYATLDHFSGGRLELIIGKGNGAARSDIAPVLRREIPDPPWGWVGGPLGDDAVPARAVAATG